jgi:Cap4 SAVED domain
MPNTARFPGKPEPFLEVRVSNLAVDPTLTGLCVGYERSKWRAAPFADHVMEWLPEFALNYSELRTVRPGNMAQLMRQAAQKVYQSRKFRNRGEFGELFLHIAVRQVFNSLPAISKIYYKTATNDPVKGFDAVHVVGPPERMELWLGEAKFYDDYSRAVRDVIEELEKHTKTDFLRGEFVLIRGKIDPEWPHAAKLNQLLSRNKSLDEIFTRTCIPVLLTYDSKCLGRHSICDAEYVRDFEAELREKYDQFKKQSLPKNIVIHLLLLPLNTKKDLIKLLDDKLTAWQAI